MKECVPYMAMVLVELAYVGSNFLCKAALENGMSFFVFIVYRHIIALLILGPFAYVLERKIRPKLTVTTAMKIFFLAFCGTTIHQTLYYAGLSYASPTVASALTNIIPAFTFLLAVFLRIEAISFRSLPGKAKIFGTVISIAGALVFTVWKGIPLNRPGTPLINIYGKASGHTVNGDWIRGSMLMSASFISFGLYLILQAVVFQYYAAPLSITALTGLFASLQSLVISLAFERRSRPWKLKWDIQLLTIIYCGTIISILVYYLQTWCIGKRGPVFVSMFQPLLLVIVGLLSFLLFGEQLHLGSLFGAIVIILGFYCVLWGKSKDSQIAHAASKPDAAFGASKEIGHAFPFPSRSTVTALDERVSLNYKNHILCIH
ncbi:unnamed protein product [Victoria cruziana]